VKKAALTMFGKDFCDRLIEPPFQVCSHLYQTLQCADWVCGLLGRLSAFQAEPANFAEFKWAEQYFLERLARIRKRSGIRTKERGLQLRAQYAVGEEAVEEIIEALELGVSQATLN